MYANGAMPADRLVEVEPGMFLEAGTAGAYLRMKAAGKSAGVTVTIAKPAGAYRSLAVQADMHKNPKKYNLDPASSVPLASVGESRHGWGTRVDVAVGAGRTWAIVQAAQFGFKREFGSADPGHFQYLSPSFAAVGISPIREDDMPRIIRHPNGAITKFGEITYQHYTNMADYQADASELGPYTQKTSDEYNRIIANTQVCRAFLYAGMPGGGGGSAVDVAAIAAKVEQNLADDFARLSAEIAAVNANIDDQPTEFTVTPA